MLFKCDNQSRINYGWCLLQTEMWRPQKERYVGKEAWFNPRVG